jgi:hypothetical protein
MRNITRVRLIRVDCMCNGWQGTQRGSEKLTTIKHCF